ncbi:MAG: hypothetical protein JJ975_09660 [Bacteroidia bacterium]|nr:hypothetical protein [Bacteroidia bacterium]
MTATPQSTPYTARTINDNDKTSARPAVCMFNGNMYVFWQSENSNDDIYCSKSNSGTTSWPDGHVVVSGNATSAPAVTVFDQKIYLFWTGESQGSPGSYSTWCQTSNDGSNWSPRKEISVFGLAIKDQPPATCTWNYQGIEWLVLGGTDTLNRTGVLFSQDGNFPSSPGVTANTNQAPALFIWNDELYQMTVNPNSPNRIEYSTWNSPTSNQGPTNEINSVDSTVASPCGMAWSSQRMLVTWRAHDDSGSIFETVGGSFPLPHGNSVPTQLGLAQSNYSPALCNLTDTNTYLFWTGKTDNKIYFIDNFDE